MGNRINERISRLADLVTTLCGHPRMCLIATVVILLDTVFGVWSGLGGVWGNINGAFTGLVGVELLFFVTHSESKSAQVRDLQNAALHVKIDALIVAIENAPNRVVGLEQAAEEQIIEAAHEIKSSVRDTIPHKEAP